MDRELNIQQAIRLLDYLINSTGKEMKNVEVLSGLILCFCYMYLEMVIGEMEKKK